MRDNAATPRTLGQFVYGPTYIDELLVYDRNISVAADPNDADARTNTNRNPTGEWCGTERRTRGGGHY